MKADFSPASMLRMSELVTARLGLRFSPDRWPELAQGVATTCAELGVADVEAWVDGVLGGLPTTAQLQALARHLTTGESYFFRQPEVFRHLADHTLPELMRARVGAEMRALRVWVAGCSTGEEAYSVAILLQQTLPPDEDWKAVVYANDLNPAALANAAEATYSEWSFRTTPEHIRRAFFRTMDGKRWTVVPEIRRRVKFSYLNLIDDTYPSLFGVPGMFDLIFCRNVLMYFPVEQQHAVLLRLRRSLGSDARLILGPCDGTLAVHELFVRERESPTIFRLPPQGRVNAPAKAELIPWEAPVPITVTSREPHWEPLEPAAPIVEARPDERLVASARAAADAGEHERALELCEKALAADKLNVEHHFLRACILIELGRPASAEAALRNVLFLDPRYVMAHFTLGTLARMRGEQENARRHFQSADELLAGIQPGAVIPGGDGLTAGRFQSMLATATQAVV